MGRYGQGARRVTDLFAGLGEFATTPAEKRKLMRKHAKPKGLHAMPIGSGPHGETCGSCANLVHKRMSKTYLKCALTIALWTGGGGTDVRAKDAACSKWAGKTA